MNNGNKINSQLLGFASLVFALDMMTPINYWLSLSTSLVIRLHATRTNTMLMECLRHQKEGTLIFNYKP